MPPTVRAQAASGELGRAAWHVRGVRGAERYVGVRVMPGLSQVDQGAVVNDCRLLVDHILLLGWFLLNLSHLLSVRRGDCMELPDVLCARTGAVGLRCPARCRRRALRGPSRRSARTAICLGIGSRERTFASVYMSRPGLRRPGRERGVRRPCRNV